LDFYLGLFGTKQVAAMLVESSRSATMIHAIQYQVLLHGIARGAAALDKSIMSSRVAAISYLLEALYFLTCLRQGSVRASKTVGPILASLMMSALLARRKETTLLGCQKKMAQNCSVTSEKTEKTERHPLDPLSMQELAEVVAILKAGKTNGKLVRFVSVNLHEPPKQEVLQYETKKMALSAIKREAFVVLVDQGDGSGGRANTQAIEAVVSLSSKSVVSYEAVDGQPAITLDEMMDVEVR
jgi:hypothetical protein